MFRAKLSKSLVQYSVDEWDCVPSLLFDLRPNYGGSNEDNGNLLQKVIMHCLTQFPWPCSRPPPTHTSASPGHSWASLGQSLVGSLLLSPGSWFAQGFFFVPSNSLFPQSCVSSGSSMMGLMATSPRGLMPYPGLLYPEPLPLWQAGHWWPVPLQETLTHSKAGLAHSLWGLLMCTKFCLNPLSISGGKGFHSKCHFPLLPSFGASPLPLDMGYLFWWDPTFCCW